MNEPSQERVDSARDSSCSLGKYCYVPGVSTSAFRTEFGRPNSSRTSDVASPLGSISLQCKLTNLGLGLPMAVCWLKSTIEKSFMLLNEVDLRSFDLSRSCKTMSLTEVCSKSAHEPKVLFLRPEMIIEVNLDLAGVTRFSTLAVAWLVDLDILDLAFYLLFVVGEGLFDRRKLVVLGSQVGHPR